MNLSVETILQYTIAAGFLAIIYGYFTGKQILSSSPGNAKMQEIASAIQVGAKAYLNRQYKTIAIVGFVVLVIITYAFNIEISPLQQGNPGDANWSENCFPDLDSPPVYLCDDILTPIDVSSTPSTPSVYIADNTCNSECAGACIPLYYCGSDGYVGVSGLSCGEYPYLGDFTSFTSPALDPPIYFYITLHWDGAELSNSGFAYPLDATCDNQNFTK